MARLETRVAKMEKAAAHVDLKAMTDDELLAYQHGCTPEIDCRDSINSCKTARAMKSGYRLESMQSSGMRHLTCCQQTTPP